MTIKLFWMDLLTEASLESDKIIVLKDAWSHLCPGEEFDMGAVMHALHDNPNFHPYLTKNAFLVNEKSPEFYENNMAQYYHNNAVIMEIKGDSIAFSSNPVYRKYNAPKSNDMTAYYMHQRHQVIGKSFGLTPLEIHRYNLGQGLRFWKNAIQEIRQDGISFLGRRCLSLLREETAVHAPWNWNFEHASSFMIFLMRHPEKMESFLSKEYDNFINDVHRIDPKDRPFLFVQTHEQGGVYLGRYGLTLPASSAHAHLSFIKTANEALDKATNILDTLQSSKPPQ